jgi:hypothetical protein
MGMKTDIDVLKIPPLLKFFFQSLISSFFHLFQEELDLSAPNKSAMLGLPKEKKWQIYCSQRGSGSGSGDGRGRLETQPEPYIEKVNALCMVRTYESID